jgi:hypothetical protein
MQTDADFANYYAAAASIQNAGIMRKSAGTAATVFDIPFFNTATTDVQAGTLDFNSTLSHADAAVVQGTGTLNIATASYSTLSGDFEPDTPGVVGALSITGAFRLDGNSALNIDVGGTAGGEYDVITVSGDVTVDGVININPIGGYVPRPGHLITILTATGTIIDDGITAPSGWMKIVTSSPSTVQLEYQG